MIGRAKFAEVGRGITDDLTRKPLVADMETKTRMVNGRPQVTDVVPPKGYVAKILGSKPTAVLRDLSDADAFWAIIDGA